MAHYDRAQHNETKRKAADQNRLPLPSVHFPTFAPPVTLRLLIFLSTSKYYFRFQQLYRDVHKYLSKTKTVSQPPLGCYRTACPGIISINVIDGVLERDTHWLVGTRAEGLDVFT